MIEIRRVLTQVEDIFHEFGPPAAEPLRRGVVAVVVANPFAGRYEPDIVPMMEALTPVGIDLAKRLRDAMDVPVERIETYGKGAIVGAAGELEHGALWHVPGGYAMRELLGWKGDRAAYAKGKVDVAAAARVADGIRGDDAADPAPRQTQNALAIVPATKKVGGPGTRLDVPLTHINASYVRSHFDAIEVSVPGAPAADEIVFVLAMTTGARIHARVGGLKATDIALWNGLR